MIDFGWVCIGEFANESLLLFSRIKPLQNLMLDLE